MENNHYFQKVTEKFRTLNYMKEDHASYIRGLILKNKLESLLELGFYHGKSSAYLAAILEDRGGPGHLVTIDNKNALKMEPSICGVLESLNLAHRVTPIFAERSYTWELSKFMSEKKYTFDFCYLDGGHTWDVTGFGFVLVDLLLKPGGYIIFDDLDWTIHNHLNNHPDNNKNWTNYSEDEKNSKGVRMVFENIVKKYNYDIEEVEKFKWGVARKRE